MLVPGLPVEINQNFQKEKYEAVQRLKSWDAVVKYIDHGSA